MQLFIVSFLILSAAYLLHPTQRRSRKKSVMVDLDINKVGFDQEKFFNVVEKSLWNLKQRIKCHMWTIYSRYIKDQEEAVLITSYDFGWSSNRKIIFSIFHLKEFQAKKGQRTSIQFKYEKSDSMLEDTPVTILRFDVWI